MAGTQGECSIPYFRSNPLIAMSEPLSIRRVVRQCRIEDREESINYLKTFSKTRESNSYVPSALLRLTVLQTGYSRLQIMTDLGNTVGG
jgi:hypothetical protein